MSWLDVAKEFAPLVRQGDIASAIDGVSRSLRDLATSAFHVVLDLRFTNPPVDVAEHVDAFLSQQDRRVTGGAAYAETNGFDVNLERWFFDLFSYSAYGGHDDFSLANIESARARTHRAVNVELVGLHWELGRYISAKVSTGEWGDGGIDELAESPP